MHLHLNMFIALQFICRSRNDDRETECLFVWLCPFVTTGQMCTACASIKVMPVASSWHWLMPDAEWPKCYDWGQIWQRAAELNTWTYACLLTPLKFRTICLGQQRTGQTHMPDKNKLIKNTHTRVIQRGFRNWLAKQPLEQHRCCLSGNKKLSYLL